MATCLPSLAAEIAAFCPAGPLPRTTRSYAVTAEPIADLLRGPLEDDFRASVEGDVADPDHLPSVGAQPIQNHRQFWAERLFHVTRGKPDDAAGYVDLVAAGQNFI